MASKCLDALMVICGTGAVVYLLFGIFTVLDFDYFINLSKTNCKKEGDCKPFTNSKHMFITQFFVASAIEIIITVLIFILNRDKNEEIKKREGRLESIDGIQLVNEAVKGKSINDDSVNSKKKSLINEEEIK